MFCLIISWLVKLIYLICIVLRRLVVNVTHVSKMSDLPLCYEMFLSTNRIGLFTVLAANVAGRQSCSKQEHLCGNSVSNMVSLITLSF